MTSLDITIHLTDDDLKQIGQALPKVLESPIIKKILLKAILEQEIQNKKEQNKPRSKRK